MLYGGALDDAYDAASEFLNKIHSKRPFLLRPKTGVPEFVGASQSGRGQRPGEIDSEGKPTANSDRKQLF